MKRRDLMKALTALAVAPRAILTGRGLRSDGQRAFASAWHDWPDMPWAGPECWGNRLQDWRVAGGRAECLVAGRNRTLHCLTTRVGEGTRDFSVTVDVEPPSAGARRSATDCLGFRIGAKGPRGDYRSAAVYGQGLDTGLTGDGRLRIGERRGGALEASGAVRLTLTAERTGASYRLTLRAASPGDPRPLASLAVDGIDAGTVIGNLALLSHVDAADETPEAPAARFAGWEVSGTALVSDAAAAFGPVCFAQYTRHRAVLKLTAQLAPVETIAGHRVTLDVRTDGAWQHGGRAARRSAVAYGPVSGGAVVSTRPTCPTACGCPCHSAAARARSTTRAPSRPSPWSSGR